MGIKMAAKFGFHGIEPWGNELENYLKQPPAVLKKVLDESGVGISSIASGGEYFDTSALNATIENNAANAKFASHFGVTALKANLNRRLGPEDLSAGQREDPRTESERGRQAHAGARREVRVSPARLDDDGTEGRGRDDPGGDRPEARVRDARHVPRLGRRLRSCRVRCATTTPASRISISRTRCRSGVRGRDGRVRRRAKRKRRRWRKSSAFLQRPIAIYQRLGTGGVDFPALIAVLRERSMPAGSAWTSTTSTCRRA